MRRGAAVLAGLLLAAVLAAGPADPAAMATPARRSPAVPAMPVTGRPAAARAGTALADFDGDGFGDLAAGAPGEDVSGAADAGAVNVFAGGPGGLGGGGRTLVQGNPEAGDRFGTALAASVFDERDRLDDLAVGVPGEDAASPDLPGRPVVTLRDTGTISVYYGASGGLAGGGQPLLPIGRQRTDGLGSSLAPAFLDDSEPFTADLIAGAPGADLGSVTDVGKIEIFVTRDQQLTFTSFSHYQGQDGVPGSREAGDRFGAALAAGPARGLTGGLPLDDLAVGASGEDVGADPDAGAVTVLFGTPGGLSTAGTRLLLQANPEAGDRLGAALAAGDLDGDGVAELAAGAPGENVGSAADAGGVELFTGPESRLLHQDALGSRAEPGDAFGSALAAG